jgi:Ca2+-binding RTX toxin-like protein
MTTPSRFILAASAVLSSTVAARSAEADGTCSFDATTGVMQVQTSGTTFLRATPNHIEMDDVACGDATVTTVDTILITGSGNLHLDTRSRPFAPGRTPEADVASEIEIDVQLDIGTLTFNLGADPDVVVLTDTQGDFFGDGDLDDFTFAGNHRLAVVAGAGDDLIDGSGLVMRDASLLGGTGDDFLEGGRSMLGHAGDDIMIARAAGGAFFDGGDGDDVSIGGAGPDRFGTRPTADGADVFIGGAGVDFISYGHRTTPVQIAMDGVSESGELVDGIPVEGDQIAVDVEDAVGGPLDDILIGNDMPNRMLGNGGNDLLDGAGADDDLQGGDGDDDITGGDGDDHLLGLYGNDFLDGGAGNDTIAGHFGDDDMVGGFGNDHMTGTAGNDTFLGGEGADAMLGGLGNDRLEGGNGPDVYRGNQDNDHLEAPADGFVEEIRCGHGADTFVAGFEDIIDQGCGDR